MGLFLKVIELSLLFICPLRENFIGITSLGLEKRLEEKAIVMMVVQG